MTMNGEKERTTDLLSKVLKSTRPEQAGEVLERFKDKLVPAGGAYSEYVRGIIKRNGLLQQEVFLKADVPERYGYKLISGEKTTQRRDVLLRLFFAAGFTLDEAQHALKLAGQPELYARIPRDAVLMIALNNGLRDPFEVDELLEKRGMEPLTPCGAE